MISGNSYLTVENLIAFAVISLLLCWAFNLVYSAISNVKQAKEREKEPFNRIDGQLKDIRSRIDTLERRVDAHDTDVSDLHAGQSVLCMGVQALLEHEMHNGNGDDMKAASDQIGKWLRAKA